MKRILVIEREFGAGGGTIAEMAAQRLGWKLLDHALTEEIARVAKVSTETCKAREERIDPWMYRLAKVFWRGSHERNSPLGDQAFDTDRMVSLMEQIAPRIAEEGNAVVVGRGAPYFLREQPDAFHVFLYAPRAEKLRRLLLDDCTKSKAEDLVDTVDRERIAFAKHYFNADWPTRSLYHVMINTAVGDESVIETILHTMHLVEGRPKATDYERPKVPSSI